MSATRFMRFDSRRTRRRRFVIAAPITGAWCPDILCRVTVSIPRGRKSLPYLDDSLTREMVVDTLRPYMSIYTSTEMLHMAIQFEGMTRCSLVWVDVALELACQI